MKKVVVTGSSGFLGKHLVKSLNKMGIETLALNSKNCDLTKDNALENVIQNPETIDHIFHLAAWTQAGTFCDTQRGIQWIVNQQINTNTLAWWQKFAPHAKMITFGTSVSYATENDLVESKYMQGEPYDKFYAYAHCKRMLLVGLECLQRQYGMNYLYFIPSTLYGPGYHTDDRQAHFIYDLIRKIIRGKMYKEPVILWGDGEQRRELVFVEDFIDIAFNLNKTVSNDIINIGGGMDYSIKEFAKIICEIVGYDFDDIQYDTTQYVGAKSKILNIEKYTLLVDKSSIKKTSLEYGIKQTIEWMQENKERFLA
ncbi:MAG: NAD-dependent epimerase/dehydratase family protein [Chitinophagaceae bacterium]